MCGILCEICYHYSASYVAKDNKILQNIRKRGPDHYNTAEIDTEKGATAFFCGSVLWMQGQKPTLQPVQNDHGILLFNGDIFDYTWNTRFSDTQLIMDNLSKEMNASIEILTYLKSLKGPFSLIYYSKASQELYFTRDRLGRNTMLFHRNENSVVISSVLGRKYDCIEVPATHIHILNLKNNKITCNSWENGVVEEYSIPDWVNMLSQQQSLPDDQFSFDFNPSLEINEEDDSVIKCIESQAGNSNKLELMETLINHIIIKNTVKSITALLEKSIKIRLEKQPNCCKTCLHYSSGACDHSAVGVLFSGGLDCTILALLADKYVPKEQSIDLINVAFKKENTSYDVPDRLTGKKSFMELKNLCPSRKWVFREVNVPKETLEHFQRSNIGDLVYPRQTILDESLGSALWFAARGQDDSTTSPCRVLLLGSGADELFGGYSRHKNAFKRKGWSGLSKELLLDWKRISFRNLSRDNRVICDHGRQPRMPYLDEDFTDFVLQLKPWLKCYPSESLGAGVGDKLMLRLVAFDLGLKEVATFPKRALQFGSRIANKKEKGSDMSSTFLKE